MRWAWLVLATACRFDPGAFRGDAASLVEDDAMVDAAPDTPPDMGIDAMVDYCDNTLACYRFENNAQDSSGNGLNATTNNVAYAAGKIGNAMQMVDGTSAADVAETTTVDVTAALTIEGWIRPTAIPGTGARVGMIDNNGQWGVFLIEANNMRCSMGAVALQTTGTIAVNEWNHVACTFDGTTTRLYVRGVLEGTGTGATMLNTGGTTGFSIAADNPPGSGQQLPGMIDELRLLPVARTATEVCEDAQLSSCP
jgi:hypothetical protein